jgi:hypothetical protein
MTTANRGKHSESYIRNLLLKLESDFVAFTFNRVMDSHAAGGRLPASPGDFQAFSKTSGKSENFCIEVKEFAHDFRISYNNFDEAKVARMYKRELAGSICVVLLYSTTMRVWRVANLRFFRQRNKSVGSWDLRSLEICQDVLETMKELLCPQEVQTLK